MRSLTAAICSGIKELALILGCFALAVLAQKHLTPTGYLVFGAATTYGTLCLFSLIGYAAETKDKS